MEILKKIITQFLKDLFASHLHITKTQKIHAILVVKKCAIVREIYFKIKLQSCVCVCV